MLLESWQSTNSCGGEKSAGGRDGSDEVRRSDSVLQHWTEKNVDVLSCLTAGSNLMVGSLLTGKNNPTPAALPDA